MFANIIHAVITVSTAAHCLTRDHGNEEVVTDQEDLPSRTEVSAAKVCINSPPDKSVYRKRSKISSTFLFLFSIKMLDIRAGIHKMCVGIANSADPDQTASSEAV